MDTKKLRQKILDLAIHGKLVPQDPNDEPASVLLERIKAEKERLIKEGKIKRSKKRTKTSDTPHYENVPYEIPDNWVWCKIKDIGEIVTGNTPSKSNAGYYGGNIPFFKPTDLEQGRDTKYARDYLSLLGFEQSRKLPVNTILVTCIGATIGKTGINTVSGSCNQQINAIIPNHGAYFLFIYYVCISNYMQCKIKKHASATTLPILNKGNFENFSFPLPPLAEQQRIVTEIEHWFALIDKIEQNKSDLKAIIKQTKNKLLDIAIHGKLVPQDLNDEPASELLKRINPKAEITCDNAHYPQLPKGWAVAPMQILCSLIDGNKQNGIERVNLDVKYLRGERDPKTLTFGKYIPANSFLILVDGENSGEVFRTPIEGYQGSTFKRLFINENMNTEYMLQVINLYRKLLRENKVGSAIPHLNKKLFKAIEVPIPPYNEQKRIVEAVNFAFKQLDVITESL
jgi:type I restriction enzyme S subunit